LFVNSNELERTHGVKQKKQQIFHLNTGGLPYMPFSRIVEPWGSSHKFRFKYDTQEFSNLFFQTFFDALKRMGWPEETAAAFWQPNYELIENIYLHSKSWGVGAIQCTNESLVLCYADIGIGVMTALEKRGRKKADEDGLVWNEETAIKLAFERGVT